MRAGAHRGGRGRAHAGEEGGPPHPAEAGDVDSSPASGGNGAVPPWAGMDAPEIRERMREAHQDRCAPYFDNRFNDHGPGSVAQEECGRTPVWRQDVDFYEDRGEEELYPLGLRACGSVWGCPVCARRICRRKGEALQSALETWRDEGGEVYMLNLTVRHHRGQRLELLMDAVQRAWTYVRTSSDQDDPLASDFEELRERFGIRGYLQSSEVTHGGNGWHPHKHVLLFTRREWSEEDVEAVEDWIFRRWRRCIVRVQDRYADGELQGVPYSRDPSRFDTTALAEPDRDVAVVIVGGEAAGHYVAKLGLGRETARIDLKEGRGRNRSPFEILRDATFRDRDRDWRLWREYLEVMHGRSHWHFSRGMKARLGGEQLETSISDQEPDREEDRRVFTIGANLWERLEGEFGRGMQATIVKTWRAGGWSDLVALFRAWCGHLEGVRLEVDSQRRELFRAATLERRTAA